MNSFQIVMAKRQKPRPRTNWMLHSFFITLNLGMFLTWLVVIGSTEIQASILHAIHNVLN